MDSSSTFLLCDEELMLSPSPEPLRCENCSRCCCCDCPSSGSLASSSDISDEELQVIFKSYMEREHAYAPDYQYAEYLQTSGGLLAARFRAVRWIVLGCDRLNLNLRTAFNAVNYLDRFISVNCCIKWETWMIELLCIACVSIASKLDEVFIPSIHDFQQDLDHTFDPRTIQEMELTVLKALDWRLCCITPHSYVDLMTYSTNSVLRDRFTRVLLRVLLDCRFLHYGACEVAASAIRCARHEAETQDSLLSRLISATNRDQVDVCCKIMEEYVASGPVIQSHDYPPSPVTVIPMQKTKIFDCHVDIDELFWKARKDLK